MGGDCLRLLFSKLSTDQKHALLDGTLFTKVEDLVSRISKDVNISLTREIIAMCREEGFEMFSTREFEDKMDFGDFDFYTTDNRDLLPLINKLFNPLVIGRNGHTTTFSYKFSPTQYFQIDFAHISDSELGKFVKSFADIGMSLGMIAAHNKLKFGEEGLFLRLNGTDLNELSETSVYKKEEEMCFELSTNVETIVSYFGLSYEYWLLGFENMERAYEWLARSKFYSPRYFVSGEEKLKRHNKPKRKFMSGFEEYSRRLISESFHDVPRPNTINYTFRFFNNQEQILDLIKNATNKKILQIERNAKFSGKKFVEKGLLNEDVGIAIKNFRKDVENNFGIQFELWLDSADINTVDSYFESFYLSQYGTPELV